MASIVLPIFLYLQLYFVWCLSVVILMYWYVFIDLLEFKKMTVINISLVFLIPYFVVDISYCCSIQSSQMVVMSDTRYTATSDSAILTAFSYYVGCMAVDATVT